MFGGCWGDETKFACEAGEEYFADECGCGCVEMAPVTCGSNVCDAGMVCCNESCGICTPPDGVCIQIACVPS
jgi:hypothetical protein